MARITVELTDEDLRTAVVEWAKAKHGMDVDPSNVSVTAQEDRRGHGMAEEKYYLKFQDAKQTAAYLVKGVR